MPFQDVIGHRRLLALLARAIHRGSLPPSLIFAGPQGVGKRLTAVAVAQALNCTDLRVAPPPADRSAPDHILELDACGRCAACSRIARNVHPDVFLIEPADTGNIRIEQVREANERAGYRPFEGRKRVVIVDDADMMAESPQNALLKNLEEPPPSSVFILVTSRPDMLLPTVRSRCPLLAFQPLSADEVSRALMQRELTETQARTVAALSEGSIGRALDLDAGDLVEARDVALRVLAGAAGSGNPRDRLDGAKDLLEGTGAGGAADRRQLATHLLAISSLLRDLALLDSGAGAALVNADVRPAIERLTAFRSDRAIHAFGVVDQGLTALDRNAGVKIVADWVLCHL